MIYVCAVLWFFLIVVECCLGQLFVLCALLCNLYELKINQLKLRDKKSNDNLSQIHAFLVLPYV